MKQNKYIESAKPYLERARSEFVSFCRKTASVSVGGKKLVVRPVLAAILAVVLIIVVLGAVLLLSGGKSRSIDMGFDAGGAYRVKPIGNSIMMYNNRGAQAVNSKGKIEWKIEEALSSPMAETGGKYVLLADLSGNHYAASYKNGKKKHEYQLGNDIISAKIRGNGIAAIATDADGYKGKVTVFNRRGREIYTWNSGSGYITDIDISDNGRYLAVAQLLSDSGEADTAIRFIDTRRGEIVASAERKGEAAVNLKFVSSNKLIAITDNHILSYSRNGKEQFSVSLEGKSPSLYSIDSDKMIAVVTVGNMGNSVIETYSMTGRLCGTYSASGVVRGIAVSGRRIIAALQGEILRLNARGKVRGTTDVGRDIKTIGYFSDGRTAFAVGSARASVIELK